MGSSQREENYDKLVTRMRELGMKEEDTMERLDIMNAQNERCALWEEIMNGKQMPCDFAESGWAEIDLAYDLNRENREE